MKPSDKTTITKEEIALKQLHDAVGLFYNEHYISAITLAGAAEEILAKLSDEAYSKILGRPIKINIADDTANFFADFLNDKIYD